MRLKPLREPPVNRSQQLARLLHLALVASAVRLCEADGGAIWRPDGDTLKVVANFGASKAWQDFAKQNPVIPDRGTMSGRVILEGKAIHIRDVLADPEFSGVGYYAHGNYRTSLGVPLLSKGDAVGVFVLARFEVKEFTDKQIELVTTFADQAVIAIENVRLLNELRQRSTDLMERTSDLTEALEQQTATSDVLQVISSSPGDLKPVFASMLENAVRICDAAFGDIFRWEGDSLRLVTSHKTPPAFAEMLKRSPVLRPSPYTRRMLETKTHVHIADLSADPIYVERMSPHIIAAVELGGIRTILAVPMLRETELIGEFILNRQEVRPFTDKQIALVTNFANQAVIAIENARLLNELRQRTTDLGERTADLTEALEQQTATSGGASGYLKLTWTILSRCLRQCWRRPFVSARRHSGISTAGNGETGHLVATYNTPKAFVEERRNAPICVPHQKVLLTGC